MSAPHIAFRCDASVVIGSGHVMRGLTLARALVERGARCSFLCRDLPGHMMARIVAEGHAVHRLAAPQGQGNGRTADGDYAAWLGVSPEEDAAECQGVLAAIQPDRLIIDHYAIDANWERAACPDAPIMVIDDLANRPHHCDILLDQNLGRRAEDYDGLVAEGTIRIIGPSNALLRPEFAAARPASLARRSKVSEFRHLLISMGGADQDNATKAILDVLATLDWPNDFRLTVVMGSIAPHLKQVMKRAETMPVHCEVLSDVSDISSILTRADAAIGAAGGSAWERCCLGVPTFVLNLADNQKHGAHALHELGAAIVLGDLRRPEWRQKLVHELSDGGHLNTLSAMSAAAAQVTDGKGAQRVANTLVAQSLHIRDATMADCEVVWRWRNEGGASVFYLNSCSTPLAEHQAWFAAALANKARVLLILEFSGKPVAHVRFDLIERDTAQVSIYVSPSIRGLGLGSIILKAACEHIVTRGVRIIEATVHRNNTASQKIFSEAGFSLVAQDGEFSIFEKLSELNGIFDL